MGITAAYILCDTRHRVDKHGRSVAEKRAAHAEGRWCESDHTGLWPFCPIFIFPLC